MTSAPFRRIVGRLGQTAMIVMFVTTIVFVLIHLAPGDPFTSAMDNPNVTEAIRARWRHAYGLDQPLSVQYIRYLASVARGDLGWSFSMRRPVLDVLLDALPNTLVLTTIALVIGFVAGIALGVVQARVAGSRRDRILGGTAMFFYAIPDFWLALITMLMFAYWVPLFPVAGAVDPVMHDYLSFTGRVADRVRHLVLPVGTLAILIAAGVSRYQRAALLRVLPEDYVRTARAKGVREGRIITRHALRNALLPIVSLIGLNLPVIFTGAIFVERVFAWPGMGWTVVNAVSTRDYPLVLAGVILTSVTVAIGSLLADILYTFADPRVRDV